MAVSKNLKEGIIFYDNDFLLNEIIGEQRNLYLLEPCLKISEVETTLNFQLFYVN